MHRLETELKSEILSAAELRARLANEPLTLEELRELLCRAGFELLSVTDSYSDREIVADTQRYCISARRI